MHYEKKKSIPIAKNYLHCEPRTKTKLPGASLRSRKVVPGKREKKRKRKAMRDRKKSKVREIVATRETRCARIETPGDDGSGVTGV